jgi:hypothetical protein
MVHGGRGGEGVRFRVMRTSVWGNDRVQPCAEAVEEEYMGRDYRGRIVRDRGPKTAWFIYLDTLDDLLAFRDTYGEIIVKKAWDDPDTYELEIYDDHRE